MRNKSLKYIFGILLSSVLLTVGCGRSSSNNPVSNGSVNSGLVSVSGNVKNADGKGTVSFYTPTAIYGNNMTNGISRAVVNNEIYTFNIDENGNYAGQIPAGDYYIIAQNSDGSMKYASARQSISMDSSVEIPEIKLVQTTDINGYLDFETTIKEESELPFVYIEGLPFVEKTTFVDGVISFTLESVPLADSYVICSDLWDNNIRYHSSTTYTDFSKSAVLTDPEPISLSGKNVKGKLTSDILTSLNGTTIIAVTKDKAYTAQTDDSGNFVMPIDISQEPIIGWGLNLDDDYVSLGSDITAGENGEYKLVYNAH